MECWDLSITALHSSFLRKILFSLSRSQYQKHHEQIRTLENFVGLDKAGIIISPEIGLHENVAVLDFNDVYANIIARHIISYGNYPVTLF
jgi:DNA polymerase elongation subunit (family B)